MACRDGGTVSVIGLSGGFVDKFPMPSRTACPWTRPQEECLKVVLTP